MALAALGVAAVLMPAPMAALAQTEAPMVFSPGDNSPKEIIKRAIIDQFTPRIYATGVITEDSADQLKAYAHQHGLTSAKVVLNSPGGSLIGGLRLGMVIRQLNFDTEVGAEAWSDEAHVTSSCASACAYAFAGGVSRYYGVDSRLGLHQFASSEGGTLRAGQEISALVVAYLQKMGVDTTAFALASRATPDDMVWLDEASALALGLANNGTLATTAEVKVVQGVPYLRLEQTRQDVKGRAILTCNSEAYLLMVGIVTDPKTTKNLAEIATRSYIEIDHRPFGIMNGPKSVSPMNDVLWVSRVIPSTVVQYLVTAHDLDVWTENGGALRRGAQIDISKVQGQIATFAANCRPGVRR